MKNEDLRWVYGNRNNKWILVGKDDRDFCYGISVKEMGKIGRDAAKIKYISPRITK